MSRSWMHQRDRGRRWLTRAGIAGAALLLGAVAPSPFLFVCACLCGGGAGGQPPVLPEAPWQPLLLLAGLGGLLLARRRGGAAATGSSRGGPRCLGAATRRLGAAAARVLAVLVILTAAFAAAAAVATAASPEQVRDAPACDCTPSGISGATDSSAGTGSDTPAALTAPVPSAGAGALQAGLEVVAAGITVAGAAMVVRLRRPREP